VACAPVRAGEVDAQAADLGGQQEHKHRLVVVEVVDEARARADRRAAVHAVVRQVGRLRVWVTAACELTTAYRQTREQAWQAQTALKFPWHAEDRCDVRQPDVLIMLGTCTSIWLAEHHHISTRLHGALRNVQHLLRLREQQRAVAGLMPVRQHLRSQWVPENRAAARQCSVDRHQAWWPGGDSRLLDWKL